MNTAQYKPRIPTFNMVHSSTLIPSRSKTWFTRQQRIKKEGSEYFSWTVPVTAAGVTSHINIGQQFTQARKYEPLDWLEICNNDVVNLALIINGDTVLPIPAGTMRTVDNQALWQIGIRNDDAAAATVLNLVQVTLRRQPLTIDQWARRGA